MGEKIVPSVGILILTHNAPEYVDKTLTSLATTQGVEYEVVVVDNCSKPENVEALHRHKQAGRIDQLLELDYNSLFAKGNNLAAELARPSSTHFVLLNSDIEIKHPAWLSFMLGVHRRGITSLGIVPSPPVRVDGFCLLIDADLYREHRLDESHEWWWGVTKLQAKVLCAGHHVQGYRHHENYIHHFGGKSGNAHKTAKGMNISVEEATSWFGGATIEVRNIAEL